MNIEFFNIKKTRVPFLIDLNINKYFESLTKNSKRYYNKSNRKWKYKTSIEISSDIYINKDIINHFELNTHKILKLKKNNDVLCLKILDKYKQIIAINFYYITNHPTFKYVYSACPWTYKKDYDLTNFLWFNSILFFRNNKFDFLDLEYESSFRIKLNKCYDQHDIIDFQYVLDNRKKSNQFDLNNSSKFIFLTSQEKNRKCMNYIMTVCTCGQKNLIKITNQNKCFKCNIQLNKIYD